MRKQHLKVASLLIAFAFQGAAVTDAAGLHGCPVHDALPGSPTTGAEGHRDPMALAVAGHQQHDPGSHSEGHGGPCTCVGSCQNTAGGSPAIVAGPASALILPTTQQAPSVAVRLELPSAPAFLLPYSQGPPPSA